MMLGAFEEIQNHRPSLVPGLSHIESLPGPTEMPGVTKAVLEIAARNKTGIHIETPGAATKTTWSTQRDQYWSAGKLWLLRGLWGAWLGNSAAKRLGSRLGLF